MASGLRELSLNVKEDDLHQALGTLASVNDAIKDYNAHFGPRLVHDENGDFWLPGMFDTRTDERIESYRRMSDLADGDDEAATKAPSM
jgi:hypothetical protein